MGEEQKKAMSPATVSSGIQLTTDFSSVYWPYCNINRKKSP